jgi:acetylornithine deacetylase
MSNKSKRQVWDHIDRKQEEVVDFLRQLIAIPSVTGDEGAIQGFIAQKARDMPLSVNLFEPDEEALRKHPAALPISRGYAGRPNVIAVLKGQGGGRSLLLNGHVDVIPAGAEGAWEFGPWSGAIRDGKIYGRGASDMKAGLAAMTMAVDAIVKTGTRLKGDVILEYVVDEELTGHGTLDCVIRGIRADGGICCETSGMAIQPGSIGRIWFEIMVKGKAAGIQRRWEGVNAIEKGYMVVQAVSKFEELRIARLSHPLYPDIRGAIPCMVGAFEAGTYHSAFPDTAHLKGSLATVPGEDSQAVKAEFVSFVKDCIHSDPWLAGNPPNIAFTGYFAEPSSIPVDSPIVQTLKQEFMNMTGKAPEISGRQGAADIRFLNETGQTPTVIFGPGRTEQMHANNEWAPLEDLTVATKILAAAIIEWCGVAE